MTRNRLYALVVMLLFVEVGSMAQTQKAKPKKPVKTAKVVTPSRTSPAEDSTLTEKKVKDMVVFLGFMLNTLGNSATSARDKDVLITESYSKIFRDAKVQVEDDLDEERTVVTNKDVVAYLKDINFFFKEVQFEFTIEKVEHGVNSEHQAFYKVSLHRNLSGTTVDGKVVNNIAPRFIEVNYNPKEQDLKIVSIYSHELNEKDALRNWWSRLSYEWQTILRKKIDLTDSVTLDDIRKMTSIEELDFSNNRYIQSFEPLSQLKNLKILNLSNTNTDDLTPIRNLTDLIDLNLSHTSIRDLSPLKYSGNLVKLNISNTGVSDIGVVQRMPKLQSLQLNTCQVSDFSAIAGLSELTFLNLSATKLSELTPVQNLPQLTELNVSKTLIVDLVPLQGLKNLKTLICDSTQIQNVSALAGLENLKILQANYTLISDLQPLHKLNHLEKVYCDKTSINKNSADAFMLSNPGVLVVYDSHDLKSWWDALSPEWQDVISKEARIGRNPTKEELARVGTIDSINISGINRITDLEPLRRFQKLRVIIANKTAIQELSPISGQFGINYLDISETRVTNLSVVCLLTKLTILKADRCKIESIDPLQKMKGLQKLYVDETGINDINANEFLQSNPKCLVIYKTVYLTRWWRKLSENWKALLRAQIPDTTRESLHQLVELEAFHFKDAPVSDLAGLSEFIRLKELHFSGTNIITIGPVENLKSLKSLHASHGPIQVSETLGQLTGLEDLDISNTPVEDLTVVGKLLKLKTLNCSGTQIKRLDAVAKLGSLEDFDCSNTNVGKLSSIDYLHLKTLKCYNTRVSKRAIENFKASHPSCTVVYYR
jgi:Leucine-rich repeat (LRR) protein